MVVIAAVDRSERAENVTSEAASLARAFDEPLHILHVMSRNEFVEIETTSVEENNRPIDIERIEEIAAEQANEAAIGVDRAYETVGRVGDATSEVLRYANEQDTRYVVVGGRKRSPTGKAVFGSVTQSILLNADCPVVTVIR